MNAIIKLRGLGYGYELSEAEIEQMKASQENQEMTTWIC